MDKNVDREAEVTVKKILTPIDRSGYKDKILAYAISLGKAWGSEITTVHVIDPAAVYRVVGLKKRNGIEKKKQKEKLKFTYLFSC